MITIELDDRGKKRYMIKRDNKLLLPLYPKPKDTIAKSFNKITGFIQDLSKFYESYFDDWFEKYVSDYIGSKKDLPDGKIIYDADIIKTYIPQIQGIVEHYIDNSGIDFEQHANTGMIDGSPKSFTAADIKNIIKASSCLKLYFIIAQDEQYCPEENTHAKIINSLSQDIFNDELFVNLYDFIAAIITNSMASDPSIGARGFARGHTSSDSLILPIIDKTIKKYLAICNTTDNPIPTIGRVIKNSIKWPEYEPGKTSKKAVGNAPDPNIELYEPLQYHTINALIKLGFNSLPVVKIAPKSFTSITDKIEHLSAIALYVTYPILSEALDIPYELFRSLHIRDYYLLNVLTCNYLPDTFKSKFPIICALMLAYNTDNPAEASGYIINDIVTFLETFTSIWTFREMTFAFKLSSNYIGIIRDLKYNSLKSNKPLAINPANLEKELIEFYNLYFSNRLKDVYRELVEKIDEALPGGDTQTAIPTMPSTPVIIKTPVAQPSVQPPINPPVTEPSVQPPAPATVRGIAATFPCVPYPEGGQPSAVEIEDAIKTLSGKITKSKLITRANNIFDARKRVPDATYEDKIRWRDELLEIFNKKRMKITVKGGKFVEPVKQKTSSPRKYKSKSMGYPHFIKKR